MALLGRAIMEKNVVKYDKDRNIAEYNTEEFTYFEALGNILYCYTYAGLKHLKQSAESAVPSYVQADEKEKYTQFIKEQHFQKHISHLMEGNEFLDCVEGGGFIDYDGTLSAVYLDGYLSNIGLAFKGICQGEFLVDGDVFKDLCSTHHVLVDWANK